MAVNPSIKRRTRGQGLKKEEWISICSAHREYNPECNMCTAGTWVNVWGHWLEHIVYVWCYPAWYWWVNKPGGRHRKNLERIFPGLRRDK